MAYFGIFYAKGPSFGFRLLIVFVRGYSFTWGGYFFLNDESSIRKNCCVFGWCYNSYFSLQFEGLQLRTASYTLYRSP